MKKMILALVAAFAMTSTVFAQNDNGNNFNRPSKEEMIKARTERTVKRYGLNDEQAKQLLELNTKYADKMRRPFGPRHGGPRMGGKNRPQGQPSDTLQRPQRPNKEQMEARMKEMKATKEAYEKELQGIMTSEQFTKYLDDEKAMMERFKKRQPAK